ncbi:MAG TPA: D-alanyl-D-alanine carboxypeptidase [Xanthobacteraceae bacterium]|nr:D-alanyl-D-alanine carboxypeptidase [Xanthobacteraceae bacterium]
MFRGQCRASGGVRSSIVGLIAVVAALALATDAADARRQRAGRHVSRHTIGDQSYSPPFAAIVVDANTGKALTETNADSSRHPASLTKIMTLYLLFERLEAGKMKLGTQLPVSEHASAQAPTKLGLRPGQHIAVEDAIRGIVTRSANDAAVVVAEAVGGDEETFARMMTSKAHALGMSRTTYVNASGLPDDAQVTTARDQAVLGRAIQERFPAYYTYFSTPSFVFRGEEIRNHNHLLGRVEGVDGIKTGYTRASGFNLVTSVRRNNRHLVAVVMGGSSASARDARMRDLIEQHIAEASTRRTATAIAEASEPVLPRPAPHPAQTKPAGEGYGLASAYAAPASPTTATAQAAIAIAAKQRVAVGSSEPIRPIAVKTIKVKLAPHTASLAPAATMIPVGEESGPTAADLAKAALADAPKAIAVTAAAQPALSPHQVAAATPASIPMPAPAAIAVPTPAPPAAAAPAAAAPARVAKNEPPPAHKPQVHTGWIVQIGAYESESEARQHLDAAQSKVKSLLGHADRFTEPVVKGEKTLYRARFAGLEKNQAEATCKQLRRNDMACMTVKN